MVRAHWLFSLLVVCVAISSAKAAEADLSEPAVSHAGNRPPNIVLIVADDLGYGAVGCYGQQKVRTPNIDRLATEGVRFTDFYAGCCMCAPSRSVLMTGKHTGHTRVRANDPKQTLTSADMTVASLLQKAGYTCGGFGKWGLGDVETPGAPSLQGFDEWVGYLDQVHAHFHYPDWIWKAGEKYPLSGNNQQNGQRETYAPDVIHDAALDFIREHKDQPFFCLVASTIPHAELLVPEDSLQDYDGRFPEKPYVGDHYASNPKPRATYAGMVTRFDRDIGRIISCLDELGLAENSLVLFTSDNGPITAGGADPEFFGNAGPLRGLKFSLYEGGIRVPMIARWKGHLAAGRTSSLVWGFDDLMSTMCELAGVKFPPGVDGVSVLPELLGRKNTPMRPYRYWEATGGAGLMQAVRADNWKAVRPQTAAPLELYDLATDLGESRNVAAQHPDIVAKMEQYVTEAHVAPQP